MLYARVAIPNRIPKPLIYIIPEGFQGKLRTGHRVLVPLGRKQTVGYVIQVEVEVEVKVEVKAVKEIIEIMDEEPVFTNEMLGLISWMASYYCAPIGEVCRSALPPRFSQIKGPKLTRPMAPHEATSEMVAHPEFKLTDDQKSALEVIDSCFRRNDAFKPILLHGITGSGKTEVYLRAFEEIAKTGGQGLALIPEISLTPQIVKRFRDRFGDKIAVYHSGLTEAQRQSQWEKMRKGEVFAAVGTRSALFAPFQNLKIIVVDEEHDSSYKQDEGLLYNARDSAVMRAKLEGAVIVLGSATPSVESFANARAEKYLYCNLSERATGAKLPDIEIVDMRYHTPHKKGSLAATTIKAIEETLARKEQTLLFLNRRGFANFLICQACGHVFSCPNCDISLTHHMSPPRLLCHYCDYQVPAPDACPVCQGCNIIPMGKGTQKLEEELTALFPDAKIARLDSDTTSKVQSRKTFLSKMQKGEIDILIGTQLIAKGHDFPNVTLVGVVDADVALHLPDFRSFERTFQILTQVSGRAGRADKPGRVIIQTYQPEHSALIHARDHDYNAFFEKEHEHRKALRYPPFARVANFKFSGNNMEQTEKAAGTALKILKEKRKTCKLEKEIDLLGPAPAPLKKVRGKFRYQLLIKAANAGKLASILTAASSSITQAIPRGCRIVVDVDPINML